MTKKQRGLGRGLDAIFTDNSIDDSPSVTELRISEIEPNRNQPRKDFDEADLNELASSIAQHGVLQPLIVRPMAGGDYQIVAGERRWRASRIAGLKTVPVVVKNYDDKQVAELSLIENLQREDLNPLEEALGYNSLMKEYKMTQDDVSKAVGKSRSAVANALRLLKLPEEVLELVRNGDLSAGHARALIPLPEEIMLQAASNVVANDFSVRETEKFVKRLMAPPKEVESKRSVPYYKEVEVTLKDYLNRRVSVAGGDKKGTLMIEFYGSEDLQELLRTLRLHK